ncbi:unnamed protein product [Lathyrus oleraceus]
MAKKLTRAMVEAATENRIAAAPLTASSAAGDASDASGAKSSLAGAAPGAYSSMGSLACAGGAEISCSLSEVEGASDGAKGDAFGEDDGADDIVGAAFGEDFGADSNKGDDLGDADGATSAITMLIMATKMRATKNS